MAIALQLEWGRCPDGYELHERKAAGATLVERSAAGTFLRPRTERRVPRRFFGIDATKAVVMAFVNAESDEALIRFCGDCGLPDKLDEMKLEAVRDLRDALRRALARSSQGDITGPQVHLGLAVDRGSTVLALRADTLGHYMAAEVVVILAGGASVLACHNCGRLFTGRSDAMWCSSRCRVAGHRQKHKA